MTNGASSLHLTCFQCMVKSMVFWVEVGGREIHFCVCKALDQFILLSSVFLFMLPCLAPLAFISSTGKSVYIDNGFIPPGLTQYWNGGLHAMPSSRARMWKTFTPVSWRLLMWIIAHWFVQLDHRNPA